MGEKFWNEVRRLGKNELGRHAFEQRMPCRITSIIDHETAASPNKLSGVVPILARLIAQDRRVKVAYLCDDESTQVYKLRGEGNNFCAYRNIQMLHPVLTGRSIPELQDMIEKAWDDGFNSHGKVETGGIKGTRKHIGTSEAQALLQSLNVQCVGQAFTGKNAYLELLDLVEGYFAAAVPSSASSTEARVHRTRCAPVFLQRPRHSLTIVGLERTRDGRRRLLVFDPGYRLPFSIKKVAVEPHGPHRCTSFVVLWVYRRDEAYLRRYGKFETLRLGKAS